METDSRGVDMLVMPIVCVTTMAVSLAFYGALGFAERQRSRSDGWVELKGEGGLLALHVSGGGEPMVGGRVELCFVSTGPLERLRDDLDVAGVRSLGPVIDEAFGRSMVIKDPGGLEIQINGRDRPTYRRPPDRRFLPAGRSLTVAGGGPPHMSDTKTSSRKRNSKTPAGSKAKKTVESAGDKTGNDVAEKTLAESPEAMATTSSYEDIADLAYKKFEAHGYQHGHDLDDWVEAERELLATHASGGKRSTEKRNPRK